MAVELPHFQGITELGPVAGVAGIAMIAEEAAALIAKGASNAGGGHYQFSIAELQSVRQQWQDLSDTIQNAQGHVRTNTPGSGPAMAPGNENASDVAANAAHTTNQAYQDYLTSMKTYVDGYVSRLTTALNQYMTTEDDNSGLAGSASGHLQA